MVFHASHDRIPFQMEKFKNSYLLIRLDQPIWEHDKLVDFRKVVPKNATGPIVVDLSRIQQISTAAFSQLLAMKCLCKKRGLSMRIQGLQKQPQALCEILKLTEVLHVEKSGTTKNQKERKEHENTSKRNTL